MTITRQFWYGVFLGLLASAGLMSLGGCDPDILDVYDEPTAVQATTAPHVVWLEWADGQARPHVGSDACRGVVAPASTADAVKRAEVADWLAVWFADFDISFVAQRPAAMTNAVVVTDGPAWCGFPGNSGGTAPFIGHPISATAYVFNGPWPAKWVASAVAQEFAHTMGLEHSALTTDIMWPLATGEAEGFLDTDGPTSGDLIGRTTQNSHAMLLAALGAR